MELLIGETHTMNQPSVYATPRDISGPEECVFYHTMDLPGFGVMKGSWDLRGRGDVYLGHVQFRGRRVLDVGTASGFLSFHIEKEGGDVVSYDLCEKYSYDVVPLFNTNYKRFQTECKDLIRKVTNAYWLAHKANNSKAKVAYGTIYNVPREIGMVDISVLGCILEHVRDPFLALQNVLRLTKNTVVIAEIYPKPTIQRRVLNGLRLPFELLDLFGGPNARFVPDSGKSQQGVWWSLWPQMLQRMIGVLGFENSTVTYHWQKYYGRKWRIYTIVAQRTREHYDY
jgi:hypothetical protein